MRVPLATLAALLLSGCLAGSDGGGEAGAAVDGLEDCRDAPLASHTYYFGADQSLVPDLPAAGSVAGNAFSSGFLTNDLREWLSLPVPEGLWIVGDVTLEFWARSTGTPAPLAFPLAGEEPGQAYQFFNQFGTDRSLQPAYATEFGDAATLPGTVSHYTEAFTMPPGGFVAEAGDRLRVLLTDLAADSPAGSGHDILFGGATPSQVRFQARCFPTVSWPVSKLLVDGSVTLVGNQGLFTGQVPPTEGVNLQTFDVIIPAEAQRLTVSLTQEDDATPGKDDMDLVLVEVGGERTWSIGSPYSDERGTLWLDNIENVFPGRQIQVQVHSYSGTAYAGRLVVTAEQAILD